jgi:FkbM family methyltransferase
MISIVQRLRTYASFVYPTLRAHRGSFSVSDAFRAFPKWNRSVNGHIDPLVDRTPWMVYPAIDFLESLLSKTSRVFEFGAGGSTLFFSGKVGELVSVEHDAEWFARTDKAMLAEKQVGGTKWIGCLLPPQPQTNVDQRDPADPLSYVSSDESFVGTQFFDYASAIDNYENEYFDIIVIDGRARPSCFLHAMNKVRMGGYIILDNAERAHYSYVEDTAEKLGFIKSEFWGPGPYNSYCWRTIFLQRTRQYFGLDDLDKKLERHLDIDGGTFVEAGANDGIKQSNTLHFESRRGWRGVLVEPVPDLFEQCRRNRPNATVVWAALTEPSEAEHQTTIRFAGLMSLARGSMKSAEEEDAHILAGCDIQRLDTYEVEVPSTTLTNIFESTGFSTIDLLSLDLEGFEHKALKGLDFDRFQPRFILVEARYPNEIEEILSHRYDLIEKLSHHDFLYRRKMDDAGNADHN